MNQANISLVVLEDDGQEIDDLIPEGWNRQNQPQLAGGSSCMEARLDKLDKTRGQSKVVGLTSRKMTGVTVRGGRSGRGRKSMTVRDIAFQATERKF